jgi:transitional endoplasmic reticulum ATPase
MTEAGKSYEMPLFWQQVRSLFNGAVAHAFLLSGNVRDLQDGGVAYQTLTTFLTSRLSGKYDVIVVVNPADGMTFPVPEHRKKVIDLLGLEGKQQANPLAAALGQSAPTEFEFPRGFPAITSILDELLTRELTTGGVVDKSAKNPKGQVKLIEVAVIIDYANFLVPAMESQAPDPAVMTRLLQWAQPGKLASDQHILFMIAESAIDIHPELRRASARWEQIDIALPSEAQRLSFVDDRIKKNAERDVAIKFANGMDPKRLAQTTGALGLRQVEDVLYWSLVENPEQGITPQLVSTRKDALVKAEFRDVLEIRNARFAFEKVGGYGYIKDYLIKYVATPWKEGKLEMGGFLMSGPPGTGKTQLAEALAGELGLPFVVFKLSKILGQYVGNSERNMERALKAIDALAPCVVFFDELDQLTGRGESATNAVDNRVFAALLTFLEDPARMGRVLALAATNRPSLLDPAMRDRFDRKAPVLPPIASERVEILRTQLSAQGIDVPTPETSEEAAEAWTKLSLLLGKSNFDRWTGRTFRNFTRVVSEFVRYDNMEPFPAVLEALMLYKPKLRDVQRMTDEALAEVEDMRLLPVQLREKSEQANAKAEERFAREEDREVRKESKRL